jgi:hypothetical protein
MRYLDSNTTPEERERMARSVTIPPKEDNEKRQDAFDGLLEALEFAGAWVRGDRRKLAHLDTIARERLLVKIQAAIAAAKEVQNDKSKDDG